MCRAQKMAQRAGAYGRPGFKTHALLALSQGIAVAPKQTKTPGVSGLEARGLISASRSFLVSEPGHRSPQCWHVAVCVIQLGYLSILLSPLDLLLPVSRAGVWQELEGLRPSGLSTEMSGTIFLATSAYLLPHICFSASQQHTNFHHEVAFSESWVVSRTLWGNRLCLQVFFVPCLCPCPLPQTFVILYLDTAFQWPKRKAGRQ